MNKDTIDGKHVAMTYFVSEIDGIPDGNITTNIIAGKYEKEYDKIINAFNELMNSKRKNNEVDSGTLELKLGREMHAS